MLGFSKRKYRAHEGSAAFIKTCLGPAPPHPAADGDRRRSEPGRQDKNGLRLAPVRDCCGQAQCWAR